MTLQKVNTKKSTELTGFFDKITIIAEISAELEKNIKIKIQDSSKVISTKGFEPLTFSLSS